MKWKLNLLEPEMLMYYYAKLLGLVPFNFENNKFHVAAPLGKLYPIILAAINLLLLVMQVRNFIEYWKQADLDDVVSSRAGLLLVIISSITPFIEQITLVVMHDKAVNLMNELCNVSKELINLGIKEDHRKLIRNYFFITFVSNIFFVLTLAACSYLRPNPAISSIIYFAVKNLINLNTILIFVRILLHIRRCFELVNKKLYDTFEPQLENYDGSSVSVVSNEVRKENEESDDQLTDLECVQKIEALHLNLCDLLDQTTHLFALPIMINCCRIFCEVVTVSYWIYSSLLNSRSVSFVSSLLLRILIAIFELLLITHASETTFRTGNAIKTVLLRMWNKIKSVEVDDEFFMFSLQLLHDQVDVSVFGFLNLGYSLVYKILCAVVTYFVVMVQFDKSKSDQST